MKEAGRPREYEPETVLQAALCRFWRHGYEATSVQDLVQATGLSRSSLYSAWGEKRDLFLAALKAYIVRTGEQTRQVLTAPGSKRDAITQLLRGRIAPPEGAPPGCFGVNAATELAPHDPDVAVLIQQAMEGNRAAFETALRDGIASGEFAPDKDPVALATFLVNALHGLAVTTRATSDKDTLESIIKVTLSVLD